MAKQRNRLLAWGLMKCGLCWKNALWGLVSSASSLVERRRGMGGVVRMNPLLFLKKARACTGEKRDTCTRIVI